MNTWNDYLRREAIKKRVAEGVTQITVAREFGLSQQRISQIAGQRRSVTQVPWDEECISFARARWDAGLTAAEIAREMGVTRNSIIGVAHRNDFPARPSPIRRAAA